MTDLKYQEIIEKVMDWWDHLDHEVSQQFIVEAYEKEHNCVLFE